MGDSTSKLTRTLSGVVVADRSDKTIAVRVDRRVRHPLYQKIIGRSSKLQVHDEANEAKIGDRVVIEECRPLSKTKSWRLASVEESV
ncbi:MAG: 30S ribosomal protein S17 [Gammaproteobacteria bacterium]|nr:30S ribosomal protein S17 [Gammaproteobacteria bacterium]